MRTINANEIETTISDLCISSNKILPKSLEEKIVQTINYERNSLATEILKDLNKNIIAAKEMSLPICQDTGMAVVFAEVGQEIIIEGGDFEDAINNGVRKGYLEGLLRCSVVKDPLSRINTNDNTPAIIHTRIVPGDHLKLTVAPKGFGSENMSSLKMFTPAAGKSEIIDFVVNVIKLAGSNPCPPVIVGVGIGGDFEYCALLAKKALCRDISISNTDPFYKDMEIEILEKLNQTDIGPQGFGGNTTALSVAIETFPTHIAGLPVAVNVGCHVTRHCTAIL